MREVIDFGTRKPLAEKAPTPEKTRNELYFNTLKAKRDVLSSHYALNQLRKGRKVEKMSDAEIEDYKSVKNEYDKRRELFLASFINLSEDDGQKVAEFTSLTKVEVELSSLETPAEDGVEVQPTERMRPEDFDVVGEARIHQEEQASVEVVSPAQAENPDRGTTMAEVDRMLKYSRDTARPLETAYWEAKKSELLERQEAESNPDRPAPKGFMQRVRDRFSKKQAEVTQSETSEPETLVQESQPTEQADAEPKKPSGWGWLKERGKGVLTFGLWEFRQAERFRSKTKEVANDTDALATQIQQERNLGVEEAHDYALELESEMKKNNLDYNDLALYYETNKDITERKRKENDEEIEYIVRSSSNDLLDKLAKYRGEAGQDVLTQENKLAFQADLRGELNKMRDGAMRKDFVNFAKLMRRNLDENWQWRYVWGVVEALAWVGVGWASMKFLAAEKVAGAGKAGAGATEKFITEGMHKSVWHSLEQMAQNGPGHFTPTPEQLMQWSKSVLDTNHWYEPEWVKGVVEGLRSSRMLSEETVMKIPLEVMKAIGY